MKKIITWDLGKTKCATGLIEYEQATKKLTCTKQYAIKLNETNSLPDLISKIENGLDFEFVDADAICIGAAGHYDGERLTHENSYSYSMHFAEVARQQHWPPFAVIHDYAPIVCATFTSYMEQAQNVKYLNDCAVKSQGRRVALGIGTGLGMKDGVLLPNGDFWLGQNEIGHTGILTPPQAEPHHLARHHEIMNYLQKKSQREANTSITFENILTGKGTLNLYQFFYPDDLVENPEEVGIKMREGNTTEMLDTFAWYLGLFVGTVQLAFMPESGIWMTGGVTLNHLDVFEKPDFFAGIRASPAYLTQRKEYPLGVLCNPEHALIGAGYYATRRLLA